MCRTGNLDFAVKVTQPTLRLPRLLAVTVPWALSMLSEIEAFVNWDRRRNSAARTWRDYSYDLYQFLAVVCDRPPGEITFREVGRFVSSQVSRGFKPATVNRRLPPFWRTQKLLNKNYSVCKVPGLGDVLLEGMLELPRSREGTALQECNRSARELRCQGRGLGGSPPPSALSSCPWQWRGSDKLTSQSKYYSSS